MKIKLHISEFANNSEACMKLYLFRKGHHQADSKMKFQFLP